MTAILSTNGATPRGQTAIAVKVLQTAKGLTAHDLAEKTGQITLHNSWSLARVAERFGFKLDVIDASKTEDGYKRYRLTPKGAKKPVAAKIAKTVKKVSTAPMKKAA